MKSALALAAVLILVSGCAGGATESTTLGAVGESLVPSVAPPTASEDAEQSPAAQTAVPSAAPAATFLPINLKGKGKKVARFVKPPVPAIAVITHAGKHNIIIDSIDVKGGENDNLVNEIGKYKGTVLFDQEDGDMSVGFKIDAEGAWTIVIKPVTDARVWSPTTVLKGAGDDVVLVQPASSGLVTLDLVFKGKHNFIVDAYSADDVENLANEIGNFSGQVLLPDGTLLLVVTAHGGAWTATPG